MNADYNIIFDKYPEVVILIKNNKIFNSNERASYILGWTKEEFKEKSIRQALSELININEVDEYIELKLQKVLEGKTESFKTICKRKDKTHFHANLTVVKVDEDFYQCTIQDISERVFFEEAIRSSEERFKLFSSVVHNGVIFIYNQIIIDCNDQLADLFKYASKTEIIGKKITKLFQEDKVKKINSTINIKRNNKSEIQTFDKNGKILYLEATASEIQYQGQSVVVYLLQDITTRKRTEIALEQSTNRFKSLVENSPNGVFIITNGKVKYANQSGISLLGFTEEDEIYNAEFVTFFSNKYQFQIQNDIDSTRKGIKINYQELTILNKQIGQIEVGIKFTLTIYKNKPSIQIAINNLTTRRKLIEEQMRAELAEEINKILKREIENHKITQKQLKQVQDFTTNIINSSIDMIIAVDTEGMITEFNTSAQKTLDFSKQEALQIPVYQLFNNENTATDIQEKVNKEGIYQGEVKILKKDNQIIDALISASPIQDESGKVIGTMGVLRDITEKKIADKEAIKKQANLDAIFNSTENMMMLTVDKKGQILSHNNNVKNKFLEIFDIKIRNEDNLYKLFKKRVNKDVYQGQMDNFKKTFKGTTQQFILPLRNKGKEETWMQVFLNPIKVEAKIDEISCLMYDITERMIIDRKILSSLKEKEVLLSEVHHRVKNNLQVISSILNLQSAYVDDEKTLEILEESQNRIKTMSFIHQTLYQTSDFSAIGFSEYIETVVVNLLQSYSLEDKEVVLIKEMDSINLPLDQSIPCGLIVNELVTNAIKYAYIGIDAPILTIRITVAKEKIEIEVKDNGIGLPKDFKYEESNSLGMQLVYSLVDQLEGELVINYDKGTSFLVKFDEIN